jgi:ABC-2 type transport system ATP-binding protein
MLEVRNVTKSYGDRPAVNNVSFEVAPGEVFALLGPNGAGKTTLIRMITDILKPDAGSIRLEGRPVTALPRGQIAYLPEERGLYRRSKVVDVLTYYGQLKGLAPTVAKDAAIGLLDRVELREWADKQVQALSKGMQQKVQLCAALIGTPRLLILDEPFSGLDPINVQLFESILHERRATGTTVLLSTHQMNKVEEVCDRALMINRGHMVLYGRVGDIRRQYADHAVIVRGQADWDGLAGVSAVKPMNGQVELALQSGTTPEDVLHALLARGARIESFALATLPLEDIFVKVVREGIGLDHGASGPPTVDEPVATGGAR